MLRARHAFIASRVADGFGIDEEEAKAGVRKYMGKLTEFLTGEGANPASHVLAYYQPRDTKNEDGEYIAGTGKPEVFFTYGDEEKLRSKAVYFIRNVDKVDLDKATDGTVIAGEVASDPLAALEAALADVYGKHAVDRPDWGKASVEAKEEFKSEIARVAAGLGETMRSFGGGLVLDAPEAGLDLEEALKSTVPRGKSKKASIEEGTVTKLQQVLELWCSQIDKYLGDVESAGQADNASGPLGILEYWRSRMQKLTSVTEQLKRKDVKIVATVLTAVTKGPHDKVPPNLFHALRKWKDIDMNITEAANEAKDNVKYLATLEKFVEPLYSGAPGAVVDTLPALMNSIKMIHTIARYFNTAERMTDLFVKITHAMIGNCKKYIVSLQAADVGESLWKKDTGALIARLEACLKLNEMYQETYRLTKEKLASNPKGKQFDFNEQAIFGRFDLFCRRVIKLIDLFSTIQQFRTLASHKLEGMEPLTKEFEDLATMFQARRHDLLAFTSTDFDRDFVEFNVNIDALEVKLQQFINGSFESIKSIDGALDLLQKFKKVLQRESLRADLDDKVAIIFQSFGNELELVQALYEEDKHNPPKPRNLPPVAGNITWCRHLLQRIESPMRRFEGYPAVFASKDGKRIVKMYNRIARTLVAYEYLWYNAWVESIETAKAGLQATLIIRHPEDGKLYVNFDAEILQLIREAKCLDRMGVAIPESAKIVLLQEDKFKGYFHDLSYALREYARITSRIIPVTAPLLKPALHDMEYRLRPGMITLTWTSMNIDAYKAHVAAGLHRLEELVRNVNDIIENRIEKNLRVVSKTLLVNLPPDRSFSLDEFVSMQQDHVQEQASILQGKNQEVESAVKDLVTMLKNYTLDPHIEAVSDEECNKLVEHYVHFMYTALLGCAKNSLNSLKKRVSARAHTSFLYTERPFFELEVQLVAPHVRLTPTLEEVQSAINKCATAVLGCSKQLYEWNQEDVAEENRASFFAKITNDIEIVRVVLLLTGSIRGTRVQVEEFLNTFDKFAWMWKSDADAIYKEFVKKDPNVDDYERELLKFSGVDDQITSVHLLHNIGALALNTAPIKGQLRQLNSQWKVQYSDNLHKTAYSQLSGLSEYFKSSLNRLNREPDSIDSIKYLMDVLYEIRDRESSIDMQINPIMDMYALLEMFLAEGYMTKEEMDMRAMLRNNWMKVRDKAEDVTEEIAGLQAGFRKKLLEDVKNFKNDVAAFRADYLKNGPMVKGIPPNEAQDRLRRFEDEFDIRNRKRELYCNGETLFALPLTEYPELDATEKELQLLAKLYGLYRDVMTRMEEWRVILWTDVVANIQSMSQETESFASRCKKMPKKLRDWDAYGALKKKIEDFQLVLPLLQELSKASIMPRHWEGVEKLTGTKLNVTDAEFRLQQLLDAPLVEKHEEITEITDGADKELGIQLKLDDIDVKWAGARFSFQPWKQRGVPVLQAIGVTVEELEEAQMQLQTMLTMRYVAFFRERAQEKLKQLSDTSETLELWQKVQLLWCSLESVFLGGDIAKQMPTVAKKFQKIDKDFVNIMQRASEQSLVIVACANEVLTTSLPMMFDELEKCQKSLEGYLEQKRNKFPRFYFVSNPVLLQILSQGSDPLQVQQYYEKIFDSISYVDHDKKDKFTILGMVSREGRAEERITFRKPVKVAGNIEDWLMDVLREMQRTMKARLEEAAGEISVVGNDMNLLRKFNDNTCGQYALLGIQLMWTSDCELALMQSKKDKNAIKNANTKALYVLNTLSGWCLQDLGSKMNRTKVETLVTIHVHQRDVINDIFTLYRAKKISGADDFEWLKQARFYWEPDARDFLDDNGACRIRITDPVFDYQFEYLGCKERLVITPLTDRCYITLAQALNMYFGGAPAGPAGTGKTETTKDMGRALGVFVVVTNCTDQMRYTDCAKIFKGLCQGGLWGCFDEFNRITLPVLSVVAQQVLAITNAKKANVEYFQFPGDPQNVLLNSVCGFFITMNPGYAGRQELPENLKALFRGVAMMVPDREIIKKVKLCSVGYSDFTLLARKFFICYQLCEQQLSKQKHYDFGLRNILSVLRTAGATKRDNVTANEEMLLYRTLRDMNLSKFVAQDVPLFLSMLADLFPKCTPPEKREYPTVMAAIKKSVDDNKLVLHDTWVGKVIQLHETCLVRHGIMLTGTAGSGKSRIMETLQAALTAVDGKQIRLARLNPKAIQAHELYGQTDPLSGEWVKGIFAAIWEKYNNRDLPYITWIVEDGPVDAIWIEDLNTVLDDNKILTLASGDRIPMTDNVKIMFENESLANASPATVSRAGIIFVSDTDLDWKPVLEAWIRSRPADHQPVFRELFLKMVGENNPLDMGHAFDFLARNCTPVMGTTRVGTMASWYNLLTSLMDRCADTITQPSVDPAKFKLQLERLMVFCETWTIGSMLEPEDLARFDAYIRKISPEACPKGDIGETVYEYVVDDRTLEWVRWKPPVWVYPNQEKLDFSNLLVPTMDSTRSLFLLDNLHAYKKPVLLLGGSGTAKTSSALMFFATFDASKRLLKRINFSSATLPGMFQESVEAELDKRGGKSFGPPNNKKMTIFVDDISMPMVNTWGDQPTNEIVRQIIEMSGIYFLDKDKRGDFKICEDLQYVSAMNHPGGGRNDIPNRLKRQFFSFNLVLPAIQSIDDLYGQMLRGRFPASEFSKECVGVVSKLTAATIELWRRVKGKMLPTPAKFHYIFNMRELSRVFQGVLLTPKDTIKTGGQQTPSTDEATNLLRLWKHECARVFQDKLASDQDKAWYASTMEEVLEAAYGSAAAEACREEVYFVDFFRNDVFDDDDVLVELAPKIYEQGGTLENVRNRVKEFMAKHNEEFPARKLELVLFDDALRHLIRISRIIEMPRGCALLVGVGGSGKQSLTRLSAYIARSKLFQITLTKTYNVNSLKDDLKGMFDTAGHLRKSVTFLFTESEIKDENFLEYLNSILMTGEVAGLFAKDEMMGMTADLQPAFVKERPGLPDTPDNLKQFFIDCARDNLHVVLCMSPVNAKFPERARKFPGLISGTTIDWFLPWPEQALIDVSKGFLNDYKVEADAPVKTQLMEHMGTVHNLVVQVCLEYFTAMRRYVYQTPKSYLAFIANYMVVYKDKLAILQRKEQNINRGLEKLVKGAEDVEAMKKVLAQEQIKLNKATDDTNKMLASLQVQQADAEQESAKVAIIKADCESEAVRIGKEKSSCEADLAKAQPIVDRAVKAVDSIKPADINEVKKLGKPSDIIRVIFDCVIILFNKYIGPPVAAELNIKKKQFEWIDPSYTLAQGIMGDAAFLKNLQSFNRDGLNEETVELVRAYTDEAEYFDPAVAKSASNAAEGLCTWVRAMVDYFYASRLIRPKLEALAVAMAALAAAQDALAKAEAREREVLATLKTLKENFDRQMAEKTKLEDNAAMLQRKLDQASSLIGGLAGERIRWGEDSKMFADTKRRLLGDVAVACAFISYCGPFNSQFRQYLVQEKFSADCRKRGVPVSKDLDVISFLVDIGTIGDWNLQGLPTDPLSIQNGILVTRSSRYPLLIDPQGQAITWLRSKEAEKLPKEPVTALTNPKLKDVVEFCMSEGKALIIVGVEETLDPLLDPVLEKQYIVRGKKKICKLADTEVEVSDEFQLYFLTRLPNPHFSPELQAKTTVVDFTVTMKGLEEQLLGRVIAREQNALEKLLQQVLSEANSNVKTLLDLDAQLLDRLSSNTGNLLDDDQLVDVLNNTKTKAAEVKEKLASAEETKKSIGEKREQFRPVATRGSVLYFSIVEMSLVNVMYQTSLAQFTELFMKSMDVAEKAALASKRVQNIIDAMTYIVYRYVNKGLYERDKLLFVFIVAVKIMVTAGLLDQSEVQLFLRGGAALDIANVRKKPTWMSNESWLNVIALSDGVAFYKSLPENIVRSESQWRRWYEDNEPERLPIPDIEGSLKENKETGPWRRLLLIRSLRMDRTLLCVRQFVRDMEGMGERYVEPVTDTIEMIFDEMTAYVPVIFLLSIGADPTDSIEQLAKKKKTSVQCVSLGEGQEPVAMKAMSAAAVNGTWVLLQNCELGLDLMDKMEDLLTKMRDAVHADFRLFITALPSPQFPLGLLQMSTKVTNEPPAGLRAGILRSYTVMVDQDRLERIDSNQWRQLVFAMCFLHSVAQERRKFGSLGWCIPYEYGNGDLSACLLFIEKHLYQGAISWPTVQYIISEVQYGGKITDNMDRRLFNTYTAAWISNAVLQPDFAYNPKAPLARIPNDFRYTIPEVGDLDAYRRFISSFPEIDSPEIFGLHPNADLTFRVKEVTALLATMAETQPKTSGGGGGKSLDEVVKEKAIELLGQLPEDYVEEDYKVKIRKLGGLTEPLNIFLFQEIQRLQAVIARVRSMLGQMVQAINGEVVMTAELLQAMRDVYDAKVPRPWLFTPGGDEFSWLLLYLGVWFAGLKEREAQLTTWLTGGRPLSFWMTGFSNPQGFLTSMKQEVTRMHRGQLWALDEVDYHTEVIELERPDQVKSAPKEGVYVHGLFIDGARWDKGTGSLAESEPKKLFAALPIFYITVMTKPLLKEKRDSMGGERGLYEIAVYRYAARTDRFRIFNGMVVTKGFAPEHWVLRGVALLCVTS